ncbi:unnamed protein product [Rhizophagus irregularis]|uniref:Phosphatidylglycerol/phosphatidylinositol transfer protein n=1 Tax=Rhizophagus irregularis TaxID=588596 RepID=A0A2N1NJV2_9GLOM|nr:hypothetical protein RhiirC2_709048 [Rhizophagus irregularis]CAB4396098.1 unnamed protein product [Rhizophagus irregularis]
MSRIFILAFVLFATLFAVNAAPLALEKRETQFQQCSDFPDVVVLDVNMTPDPPVSNTEETFVIKGTMKTNIIAGDWLAFIFYDLYEQQPIGDTHWFDICTRPGVTCPIKAGKAFSITQKCTTSELPLLYTIGILIGHHELTKPYACSVAKIIGDSESSAVPDF